MDTSSLLILHLGTTMENDIPHEKQKLEIIEAHIASVDTVKNAPVEYDHFFVKPKSKISSFCESLFGIKQDKLDSDGIDFLEVYRKLMVHYMSRDRVWGTWGRFSVFALESQCKLLNLGMPCSDSHIDIQKLFAMMTGENPNIDLRNAIRFSDLREISNNPAVNIGALFCKMASGLRPPIKSRILVSAPSNRSVN